MIQSEVAGTIQKLTTYFVNRGFKQYHQYLIRFELFHAPPGYFDLDYEKRKELLKAPSVEYLCKSIIMENTQYDEKYADSIYYPKYICVVVQYISKIQAEKIIKYFKNLQNTNIKENPAPRSKFNFRLTSNEQSFKLSGYEFNAITPFDMAAKMPVLLSDRIQTPYIWFGGGHVDVKLKMDIQEFKSLYDDQVLVADIVY